LVSLAVSILAALRIESVYKSKKRKVRLLGCKLPFRNVLFEHLLATVLAVQELVDILNDVVVDELILVHVIERLVEVALQIRNIRRFNYVVL